MSAQKVRTHNDLDVYKRAFSAAMQIHNLSTQFPVEEKYSLTDQLRRASRSVCANLAEAWRKRRYEKAFVSKLSDVEAEAAEVQVWLEFAVECGYIPRDTAADLYQQYNSILRTIVGMINHPQSWILPGRTD
ncbi:MAG: four helix bundle protein [Chloroflexota bacterium]